MNTRTNLGVVIASAVLAFAAATLSAQSTVYRWVDANGSVHFGDSPPGETTGIEADVILFPDVQTSFRTIPAPPARADEAESMEDSAAAPVPTNNSARSTPPRSEQCSDESPTVSAGQDLFDFNAEPQPLPAREIDRFRTIVNLMQGRWRGPDSGFYCVERGAADEKRPFDRTIEAEGNLSRTDSYVLDSTLRSQGSNRRELLRIELRDGRLLVNSETATLTSVSDRELAFGYRILIGGIVTEYYWRVELSGSRTMNLQQWTYTQGELSASSSWNLTKER